MSTTSAAAGAWLHHPVTGELARVNVSPADTGGRRMEADLWLQPGAAVARAHVHEHLVERFEVLEGAIGVVVAGRGDVVRAGDPPVEVPAGTAHDWWNEGAGIAHVHVDIAAAPSAPGRPAQRFLSMIEAMWSLGALGRVDAHGMPKGLWLAVSAREYRVAIRFTTPPAAVQAALLGPLALVARRTSHDMNAPELHGPTAACAIADPGDDGLAVLLAGPARSARSRARRSSRPARSRRP